MAEFKRVWKKIVSTEVVPGNNRGNTRLIALECGHVLRQGALKGVPKSDKGCVCHECEKAARQTRNHAGGA